MLRDLPRGEERRRRVPAALAFGAGVALVRSIH